MITRMMLIMAMMKMVVYPGIVSRLLQFAVCVDIYVQEVGNDSTITITRSSSSWSFYYDNVVVFAAYHVGPNSGTIEVSAQLLFL
mmetsp:Transcript_28124/g.71323  ORF Transcript_28124/g.71323 Transcript_28124/m.71323 type:complete len:85 (-) Transcript_28124:906-1160(-)